VVRYLYATSLPYGIVVEVDIGALVETMMDWLLGGWGDVVMDVCEAITELVRIILHGVDGVLTASTTTLRPAVEAYCVRNSELSQASKRRCGACCS
jgi:hypothetical protein